ncbi:MAG TPA: NAAT family transporter [Gammaproteobacteria bacterium]|nr:NAAT family transporter [Gammaproteobacteria bacterium]
MVFSPEYTLYAKALIGVLAIVNPLGAVPIFLSLCEDRSEAQCRQVAATAALAVAIILVLSTWAGDAILAFFGIGVPAFRAGGGLLILLMAINMLHARRGHTRQSPEEADEASGKENIAVVPLAIPLMAGPGAISLVIVDAHQSSGWIDRLILSAGIILVALTVWIALRMATPIGEKLGITGLNIATRVMGLLLAAIGMQMLTAGLVELLPGLGRV